MEEKYVAILMRKIKTYKNFYFLKLEVVVTDAMINENDELIMPDFKNIYKYYYDNIEFYFSKNTDICYGYPITYSDLKNFRYVVHFGG